MVIMIGDNMIKHIKIKRTSLSILDSLSCSCLQLRNEHKIIHKYERIRRE